MRARSFAANWKPAFGGITLVLSTVLVVSGAASSSIAPICAARDLDVITLIEQHGTAEDVAPERLAKAAMAVFAAREACEAGRTEKAVALYDDITGSLGSLMSQRVR
jgi:hypothetical protein